MFRSIVPSLAIVLTTLSIGIDTVKAQSMDTSLVLMPHCVEADRTKCQSFQALDPSTLTTEKHAVGDIIDVDIVLRTEKPKDVETVRAWLSFDTKALEARSVELSKDINSPLPGEQTIEKSMGIVKIGANVGGRINANEVVIARVTFRVLTAESNAIISFHHYLPNGQGETAVNGKEGTSTDSRGGTLPKPPCFDKILGCTPEINALLTVEPSTVHVTLVDPSATQVVPVVSAEQALTVQNTSTGTPTVMPVMENRGSEQASTPPTSQVSAFTLLQVQNLRVTTRDRDIYVGWMPLGSSELKGYNVYYSTVSGRYVQRHTLPDNTTSYTIRDLEPGSTYFIAIRAFNQNNVESAFSQEVSVTVGRPETSSAPLSAITQEPTPLDGNPITTRGGPSITGETGAPSVLFIVIAISAVLGTLLAFHRQLILHRSTYHV